MKVIKVEVVPCVMTRITIKNIKRSKVYKKLCLKMLEGNVTLKVINVLKDTIY
jgi:hypothetical protein